MKIAIVGPGFLGKKLASHLSIKHNLTLLGRGFDVNKLNLFELIIVTVAPKNKEEYESCYLELARHITQNISSDIPIIYTSSTSVYGKPDNLLVDENSPLNPIHSNQNILIATEEVYKKHPKTTLIRLGEIYGYERNHLNRLKKQEAYPGDGSSICNLVHVDDVVLFTEYCIENNLFGVFNLVADTHITRKELLQKIASYNALPAPRFDPNLVAYHGSKKIVDNKKVKATGYQFKHPTFKIPLEIAFSFCPNDTFLMGALVLNLIDHPFDLITIVKDVQQLNEDAKMGLYPITKISYYCLAKLKDYTYFPTGNTLGFGVGPKIIAKAPFTLDELKTKKIAIPGQDTTAHYLLQELLPECKNKFFCTYNEVFSLLKEGVVDAGIIIHEQRFTFKEESFVEIVDLGVLWEVKTSGPLPLGAIAHKRELVADIVKEIDELLHKSLLFACKEGSHLMDYIQSMATEKNHEAISSHIALYVNSETLNLSEQGLRAINNFLKNN